MSWCPVWSLLPLSTLLASSLAQVSEIDISDIYSHCPPPQTLFFKSKSHFPFLDCVMAVAGWSYAKWVYWRKKKKNQSLSLWPESSCYHNFHIFPLFSRNLLSHMLRQWQHCIQMTRAREFPFDNHGAHCGGRVGGVLLLLQPWLLRELFYVKMVCFYAVLLSVWTDHSFNGMLCFHMCVQLNIFYFFPAEPTGSFGLYEHGNRFSQECGVESQN